ncbi:Alpha/beta hydrolase family protein [Modestobacter sp. DSM 44400]|uniref:esterase/lipase family protein n=1 Tax=Modestobacter sp. DSM 44400 TaxID=1550230 RepID=UPI00089CBAA2|nr:alpha/beta fold hydrolase [Modestobacter sp. DSM 44400]SDX51147.1 Alpha/beta hydrolase family protein [Modestobacter sp. DSM 44400]
MDTSDLVAAPGWHATLPTAGSDVPATPTGARGGLRSLLSATLVTGGLTELAWVGAHALLYPLGARTEQLRPDGRYRPGVQPPAVRALFADDPLAARIPVVLVHGLVDNRSVFTVMRRSLRRRGFAQVCTWNYSPLLRDVESAAAALGAHIEEICQETGHERVHVVGHSLGGLVARYLVQRLGGDRRVESLVTLGTPHGGTLWAHMLPTSLVRQLRPGSRLLRELAEPAPGCRTPVTAVYSDMDQMLVPSRVGRCDHPDLQVRNVLVRGVGHMSLPIHRAVVDEVAATLAGRRTVPAGNHPASDSTAVA